MPTLWQNKDAVSGETPEQHFFVGNQADDTFAYMWSRIGERPFRNTVRIRSEGMWGWNTVNSYDVLMQLAKLWKLTPQVSPLQEVSLHEPQKWSGIKHQYSDGKYNQHLLVPVVQDDPWIVTLGISDKNNTKMHVIDFLRSHFQGEVFNLLEALSQAIKEDNRVFGHWYANP